jgi:hypothetical protein
MLDQAWSVRDWPIQKRRRRLSYGKGKKVKENEETCSNATTPSRIGGTPGRVTLPPRPHPSERGPAQRRAGSGRLRSKPSQHRQEDARARAEEHSSPTGKAKQTHFFVFVRPHRSLSSFTPRPRPRDAAATGTGPAAAAAAARRRWTAPAAGTPSTGTKSRYGTPPPLLPLPLLRSARPATGDPSGCAPAMPARRLSLYFCASVSAGRLGLGRGIRYGRGADASRCMRGRPRAYGVVDVRDSLRGWVFWDVVTMMRFLTFLDFLQGSEAAEVGRPGRQGQHGRLPARGRGGYRPGNRNFWHNL